MRDGREKLQSRGHGMASEEKVSQRRNGGIN